MSEQNAIQAGVEILKQREEAAANQAESTMPESVKQSIEDNNINDITENVEETTEPTENPEENTEEVEGQENEEIFVVTVNGQETEVPLSQLLETYQKQDSADKKFQEAAEIRKMSSAEIAHTQAVRQQYADTIVKLEQTLDSQKLTDEQLKELEAKDPKQALEYTRWLHNEEAKLQKEANDFVGSLKQEADQALHVAAQHIPDWKTNEDVNKDYNLMYQHAGKYGIPAEQIDLITDPRIIILLRDAAKGGPSTGNSNEVSIKRKSMPTSIPRGAGAPRQTTSTLKSLQKNVENARAKLAESKSEQDALALMKAQDELNKYKN